MFFISLKSSFTFEICGTRFFFPSYTFLFWFSEKRWWSKTSKCCFSYLFLFFFTSWIIDWSPNSCVTWTLVGAIHWRIWYYLPIRDTKRDKCKLFKLKHLTYIVILEIIFLSFYHFTFTWYLILLILLISHWFYYFSYKKLIQKLIGANVNCVF